MKGKRAIAKDAFAWNPQEN